MTTYKNYDHSGAFFDRSEENELIFVDNKTIIKEIGVG